MIEWSEVIWTVVSLVGAVAGIRLFVLARGDLAVLRAMKVNSARTVLAKMNVRFGGIIAVAETWYVILGFLAMFQPSPGRTRTGLGTITLIVFIAIQAAFALGLVLNLRDRNRLTTPQPGQ